jgi:superfamily II DNA or RNA helicase
MTSYTQGERELIKRELTCIVKSDYGPDKKYQFYKDDWTIPLVWGMRNIKTFKPPNFETTKTSNFHCNISLKPLQLECMKEIDLQFAKDIGGGIINLSTGSGKTVLSLYTISKYKLKTLIIVNTVELMNQWIQSIKKFLGSVRIGIIRGDRFDKDCDITIGMLQTISMRAQYTKEMFKDFSLLFIDECHHLSSEVFSEALFKCRSKYSFGLSATITRKDGLEFVFRYHLGDVIFSDSNRGSSKQKSTIKQIPFKGESSIEKRLFNGKPKISTMITNISDDPKRNKLIAETLLALEDARRVLVLSDRLHQLQVLHKLLGPEKSGIFVGKTTKEDKEVAKTKKIMLATYNIASEGFDHPVLNTLLFATPRTNVIQSVGRIYRKTHKIEPMIIDIVDDFSIFPYQYKKRAKIYAEHLNIKGDHSQPDNDVCLFE